MSGEKTESGEKAGEFQSAPLDRAIEQFNPLLQCLVYMPSAQAVVDISLKQIEQAHRLAIEAIRAVFLLQDRKLGLAFVRFFESWKELKIPLVEGWDVQKIRSRARTCLAALLALQELYQTLRAERERASQMQFWQGDAIRLSVRAALDELPTERSRALRQLYTTFKRCLQMSSKHWRVRQIEIFFGLLAHYQLELAVKFLDAFSFEQRELKDVALLCIISRLKPENCEDYARLLELFSDLERRQDGLYLLFKSCYEQNPELGIRLIKKMSSRLRRNEALALLSLARARAGDRQAAEQYCQQISSVSLKRKQELLIAEQLRTRHERAALYRSSPDALLAGSARAPRSPQPPQAYAWTAKRRLGSV